MHSEYEFQRRHRHATVEKQSALPLSIPELIGKLARVCDDKQIARILNRHGFPADENQTWSQSHVLQFRQQYNIAPFSQQQYAERNLVTLKQAAQILQVSMATISQLIQANIIQASQVIKHAPWEIDRQQLDKPAVKHYLSQMKKGSPVVYNKDQLPLNINEKHDKEQ